MKTMKRIKANKLCYFVFRTRCPLENFKFFMNFMVEAAEVDLQEKIMDRPGVKRESSCGR